jgi:hypothetical protein
MRGDEGVRRSEPLFFTLKGALQVHFRGRAYKLGLGSPPAPSSQGVQGRSLRYLALLGDSGFF